MWYKEELKGYSMSDTISLLSRLKQDLIDGSSELVENEAVAASYVAAIDEAMRDIQRIDFVDIHGLDWDGLGAYIDSVGNFSGDNLRDILDKAMAAWKKIE